MKGRSKKKGFVLALNNLVLLIIIIVVIFSIILFLVRTNSNFFNESNSFVKGATSTSFPKKFSWEQSNNENPSSNPSNQPSIPSVPASSGGGEPGSQIPLPPNPSPASP